ncbi:MAG: DUF1566 domain-containing protein [Arcobacteraceae bacterium]|nr:DUF1566 domain-containing protein [Arcobacteraceae bacterium]
MSILPKMKLLKIATLMIFVEESNLFATSNQQASSKNGVYLDYQKNLMWQDDISAKEIRKNWDGAMDYCDNLTLAGYGDWYLPNKDDLETLFKQKNLLKNKQTAPYWSSSSVSSKIDSGWIIFFSNGSEAWRSKKIPNNVRCVRGR